MNNQAPVNPATPASPMNATIEPTEDRPVWRDTDEWPPASPESAQNGDLSDFQATDASP